MHTWRNSSPEDEAQQLKPKSLVPGGMPWGAWDIGGRVAGGRHDLHETPPSVAEARAGSWESPEEREARVLRQLNPLKSD